MTKLEDGGPAFPRPPVINTNPADDGGYESSHAEGMSLRDWFAGQAIMGICQYGLGTLAVEWTENGIGNERVSHLRSCATIAYGIADAMLAAREEPSE